MQKEREKNPEFSFEKRKHLGNEKIINKKKKPEELKEIKKNDFKQNLHDNSRKTPKYTDKLGGIDLKNKPEKPSKTKIKQKLSSDDDEDEEEKNDVIKEVPDRKSESDCSSSSEDEGNKKKDKKVI